MNILNSKLFINILFHVTILFNFLSLLFIKIVRNKTEEAINSTFINFLHSFFNNINDNIKSNYNSNLRNYYRIIQNLGSNNPDLQYKTLNLIKANISQYPELQSFLTNNLSNNNDKEILLFFELINKMIYNFNFDYYQKLFEKNQRSREIINSNLIDNILYVNVILVVFLIFVCLILLNTKNITINEIFEVVQENILVFLLIGLFEYLFFTDIASKYLPSPPSELIEILFKDIKDNFNST